ncbi:hypothetical protein E2C01_074222 [Portunus trituberculatus]|uniref:Uncharacterized protein n=1 Tax=Portunus trituberculatus TaxID=210409 RepID=A0A5B7I2U2_PORTR|nr:hypothetical protein [Portunus trituberculatus]
MPGATQTPSQDFLPLLPSGTTQYTSPVSFPFLLVRPSTRPQQSSGTTQYTIPGGSPLSFLPSQATGWTCLTDAAAHTLPASRSSHHSHCRQEPRGVLWDLPD